MRVADALYCNYFLIARLQARAVDVLFEQKGNWRQAKIVPEDRTADRVIDDQTRIEALHSNLIAPRLAAYLGLNALPCNDQLEELGESRFRPAPPPNGVGHGPEAIQGALDAQRNGVPLPRLLFVMLD